ncbi:biogenesis of lysosome-related organelles complex 1 subunit 4-like [Argiope bruennichi]|uniref:biogenesis of lysosome-related organelles complex 1 subunit 4-like n=1 Tax=Argiope bruennichi TaxID=94029 RepID=UPI00249459C2|nr:biogenesis of lysosome-related organelles complex 1 subunit 4-like [Argiope bruennichi]
MAEEVVSPEASGNNSFDEKLTDRVKLDALVTDLAQEYSKYLKVDVSAEKTILEDEVEDVLTRLDEFTSLVDMVRSDNTVCLNQKLPGIHEKFAEMEKVFVQIDRLEDMIKVIKQNLEVMEEKVNEAEEHLDSSSVKKLFNSFQKPLFSKKTGDQKKHLKYESPEIFKTDDFFPNSASSAENANT